MGLRNLDGVWLSEDKLTSAVPSIQLRADGDRYRILFNLFEREVLGNTEFTTEEECQKAISTLFSNPSEITESKADAIYEEIDSVTKRINSLENHVAKLEYEEGEWDNIELENL